MIRPGDRLVLEFGGGGGWGDPAQRDPEARSDVENGFVTGGGAERRRATEALVIARSRRRRSNLDNAEPSRANCFAPLAMTLRMRLS